MRNYENISLKVDLDDLVLYDNQKWFFKSFHDNLNYCTLYLRNKELDVRFDEIKPIELSLDLFKKDLFFIEKGVNDVYEEELNIHYKKIDLPFFIKYSESFGFRVSSNEYEFEVKYLKDIINLFNSFKIDTFSKSVCL